MRENRSRNKERPVTTRRCGACGKPGHNTRRGRRINKPTKQKDALVCLHRLICCFVGLFDNICCGVGFVCLDIAVLA
jgi:hypothetical protein